MDTKTLLINIFGWTLTLIAQFIFWKLNQREEKKRREMYAKEKMVERDMQKYNDFIDSLETLFMTNQKTYRETLRFLESDEEESPKLLELINKLQEGDEQLDIVAGKGLFLLEEFGDKKLIEEAIEFHENRNGADSEFFKLIDRYVSAINREGALIILDLMKEQFDLVKTCENDLIDFHRGARYLVQADIYKSI